MKGFDQGKGIDVKKRRLITLITLLILLLPVKVWEGVVKWASDVKWTWRAGERCPRCWNELWRGNRKG